MTTVQLYFDPMIYTKNLGYPINLADAYVLYGFTYIPSDHNTWILRLHVTLPQHDAVYNDSLCFMRYTDSGMLR